MSAILARPMNRRAFRREVRLSCQVVRERDFRLVADFALDLSTDGMLVSTKLPVLTGEELIVTFRAPQSAMWIDAEATVARVIHGRRPGDHGRSIGLTFHSMSEAMNRKLFEQLRGLPPPLPTRSSRFGTAVMS